MISDDLVRRFLSGVESLDPDYQISTEQIKAGIEAVLRLGTVDNQDTCVVDPVPTDAEYRTEALHCAASQSYHYSGTKEVIEAAEIYTRWLRTGLRPWTQVD